MSTEAPFAPPPFSMTVRPASFEEVCRAYVGGFIAAVHSRAPIRERGIWTIIERGPVGAPTAGFSGPFGNAADAEQARSSAERQVQILRDNPELCSSMQLGTNPKNSVAFGNSNFRISIVGMGRAHDAFIALGTGYTMYGLNGQNIREILETFPLPFAREHLGKMFPAIFAE